MRALVQRVREASVTVAGKVVGRCGPGLCVFVGCTHTDEAATADRLADKVFELRVLDDSSVGPSERRRGTSRGETRALSDADTAQALVVSQFTLYADTRKGRRPSWSAAAPGALAEPLVERFAARLEARGCTVGRGVFGADMLVELANDGPMTVLVEV